MGWLSTAFGFKTLMEIPGTNGSIAHAEMRLGPGVIMLASVRDEPTNPWASVKHGIYAYVEDIDGHYARARGANAQIVRELEDTPHGSREYSVLDSEGFVWAFGNFRPPDDDR
jgi:uncharacterized glyoxalase superfamily protein PhnB